MAKKQSGTNKKDAKKPVLKAKTIQLQIERINPDHIRSVPVNDIIINHSQSEFFITFSSVEPPQLLDPKRIHELKEINAITRAKLVISPEFLEAVIKALTVNLEGFKKEKTQR